MASIKISDINPAGTDLFSDPESFMNELNDDEFAQELGSVKGGLTESLTVWLIASEFTGADPSVAGAHPTSITRKTIYSI